jgi:8-oxo-dGTP diphosphatase
VVILRVRAVGLTVLLVRRTAEPFARQWALPGGFVMADETLHETARRVASENVGAENIDWQVQQIGTYSEPSEGATRVVSVTYVALIPDLVVPSSDLDRDCVRWWLTKDLGTEFLPDLAFDHARILNDGIERARAELEHTSRAISLVEAHFTLRDLQRIYEAVWGVELQPANFRRKVLSIADFVMQTKETRSKGRGHPAQLYRRGPTRQLHPAMLRPSPEVVSGAVRRPNRGP